MASLKTIAERCGVSTATVSKALNDQKDISEETKKRIKAVANEMGYYPNSAARALKTNRSYNLGILFAADDGVGLKHEYFSNVLNGVKFIAEQRGYDITFINTFFGDRKMSYYDHCKCRNFDGIIIACADFQNLEVMDLMNRDIPIVTIDYVHHNCTAVCSNNVKGIEDIINFVYQNGHRKIAYIHGQASSSVTRDRTTSFFRTMEQLNLTVPDEYVRAANYLDTKGAAEETLKLLKLKDPPTCILYPDDTALLGGQNMIIQMGLRIPDDISIVGYDGTRVSQLLYPKITTIKQNAELVGREAAKRLVETIEKPKTTLIERVVINGKLISGQSVSNLT